MLLLGPPVLQLCPHIEQDLICSADGVIKIAEGRRAFRFSLNDVLICIFALHGFADAGEILLMLEVALLDIVELLLAGFVLLECGLVEEVAVLLALLEDVERHLERGVLELDDEVNEELVLVLGDRKLLPDLPELLGHPVGHDRDVLEVVDVGADAGDLFGEAARQPEFPPGGALLVLVDEGEADDFGDGWVGVLLDDDFAAFGEFADEGEGVVRAGGAGVHEGVAAVVDEVEQAPRRPHVALEGVLLVLELLGRCVDGRPLIEGEVVELGDIGVVDAARAPEIGHLDDHALGDEYILGFEIAVEDALDVHDDEGLDDLLEDAEYLSNRQLFILLLEVVEQIALLAVLHDDF